MLQLWLDHARLPILQHWQTRWSSRSCSRSRQFGHGLKPKPKLKPWFRKGPKVSPLIVYRGRFHNFNVNNFVKPWKQTRLKTTSLTVTSVLFSDILFPFGSGDVSLSRSDDVYSDVITPPISVPFFGQSFSSLFVSGNFFVFVFEIKLKLN